MGTSACISVLYFAHTWLVFEVTRRLPSARSVRFFARNTLIVFILHMPLYYALYPVVHNMVPAGAPRVFVNVAIYFVALAIVSELINKLVQPKLLRERIAERLGVRFSMWRAEVARSD